MLVPPAISEQLRRLLRHLFGKSAPFESWQFQSNSEGAELEPKDKDGRTPLWWTIRNRHEAVVKLLLEKGAEVEPKEKDMVRRTPLPWAAENGNETVMKLLLPSKSLLDPK